ncbi:MAG TPA: hypothetical protein VIL42_09385 [Sphingomicrobium sp.]
MIHGHNIAASSAHAERNVSFSTAMNPTRRVAPWRRLDAERRLQLIDQVLRTTDGLVDEYSLAL